MNKEQLLDRKKQREREFALAQQQLIEWQAAVQRQVGAISELNDQLKELENESPPTTNQPE